jgi:hypothetical protein
MSSLLAQLCAALVLSLADFVLLLLLLLLLLQLPPTDRQSGSIHSWVSSLLAQLCAAVVLPQLL